MSLRNVARPTSLSLIAMMAVASSVPASPATRNPRVGSVAPGIQRERVSLVLVDVVVTDESGRFLEGLRPDEFALLVDGRPATIQSVDLQRTGRSAPDVATTKARGETGLAGGPSPAPVLLRGRGIVLFFDGLNSERGLGREPLESAQRFLRSGLQDGDEVMVVGLGHELRVYQEFTSDAAVAEAALQRMEEDPGIRQGGESRIVRNLEDLSETPGLARVMAAEDKHRARRFLTSVRAVVEFLRTGPGRKELFIFSDGFPPNPDELYGVPQATGLEPEIVELAREAASAQVSLNTLNTLGLSTGPPGAPEVVVERVATEALGALALNSGGVLTHGMNRGFQGPMRRIEEQGRATYLLSYSPPGEPDGKMHSIRVLVQRPHSVVRSPQGFLWMTEEQRREKETLAAFVTPALYTGLPLSLGASWYIQEGKSAVEFAITVPESSLLFLPREGHLLARLEGGLVLRSVLGDFADQFSRSVEVRVPGRNLADPGDLTLLAERIVPAGEYEAVAVVRDLESGDLGALRTQVKVPAFRPDQLAMSSLALSGLNPSARVVRLDPAEPRSHSSGLPPASSAFSSSEKVTGSCILYNPKRELLTGEARATLQISILHGNDLVRKLPTLGHQLRTGDGRSSMFLEFPVDLKSLQPGAYRLDVEARDEVADRAVSQRVEFTVR